MIYITLPARRISAEHIGSFGSDDEAVVVGDPEVEHVGTVGGNRDALKLKLFLKKSSGFI